MLTHISDRRPDAEIDKVLTAVLDDAKTLWSPLGYEGEYPISGFGITELRPRDVYSTAGDMAGSAYWSMSAAAGSTWYSWIDLTTTDMAYLIITGVINLSPSPQVVELKPVPNGQEGPVLNLEQMYALDLARAFLPKPFAVKPSGTLVLKDQARVAVTDERLGLLGYTVAKRSYLIKE